MSRIGKKPIEIPDGVKVNIDQGKISVTGPKGTLERLIPQGVSLEMNEATLKVIRPDDARRSRAQQGLLRALVANMVTGVSKGFERGLLINGVGYRAEKTGSKITFHLGFSHKVEMEIPSQLDIVIAKPTEIMVKGIDRELVGQVAAKIRSLRKADPYKAKGITYQGEKILRKAGKKAIG